MELHGLAKDAGSAGDSARSALIAITKAINKRTDLKIVTAMGSDLTKIGFFREKLNSSIDEGEMSVDNIIMGTTKNVADSRHKTAVDTNKAAPQGAEPAVLLTEDVNMHTKAFANNVPAISTSVFKSYLRMHRSNGKCRSNGKNRSNGRNRSNSKNRSN